MTLSIRICITISLMLFSLTRGQNPGAPAPDEKATAGRHAWIVTTSLPQGMKSPATILANGKLSKVNLLKRSVGEAITVPPDGLIRMVNPTVGEDGKPSYEVIASVQIPEGIRESLIILVPIADLPPPLKFKGRVIDLDKFRDGDALFVNMTSAEIGVSLGEKRSIIKTGQMEVIDSGDFKGVKNTTVSYHYRTSTEQKWNLISASTVPMRSSRREILIFSYDSKLGQIDYHGISFLAHQ